MRSTGLLTSFVLDPQQGKIYGMKRFFKLLFNPHDGTRRDLLESVTQARQDIEKASSRLDYVVRRMIQENDRLRRNPNAQKPSH